MRFRFFFFFLCTLTSCQFGKDSDQSKKGAELAQIHCSGCHLQPDPALLDKKSWREGVLPAMAVQLGIEVLEGNMYLNTKNAVLSNKDWLEIVNYYESLAPDSLIQATQLPADPASWSIFRLRKPAPDTTQFSGTLMTAINPEEKAVYTSSVNDSNLYKWDIHLNPTAVTSLSSAAVYIAFTHEPAPKMVLTCMGGMRALDITKGDIYSISQNQRGAYSKIKLASDFIRPIHSRPMDFDKDGLTDYAVCSFGHNKGGLYVLKHLPDHSFQKLPVREIPGAIQSITGDFNQDGWQDIMALFAHGDEGIWLFSNDKKGGFESKNILRFPSVYGSSSFQLVDMNKDGKPDIVYTAGDNSDYSRILKPYHGLYIYLNQGNSGGASMDFKQSYFYPLNGCTKAIATDFDQDGDVDIAAIAFFADFVNKPSETFTYLEHNQAGKELSFKPNSLPIQKNGRWICMDANDYDGDGDQDIVLGNYSKGFLNQEQFKPTWDVHTPFIILENETRR